MAWISVLITWFLLFNASLGQNINDIYYEPDDSPIGNIPDIDVGPDPIVDGRSSIFKRIRSLFQRTDDQSDRVLQIFQDQIRRLSDDYDSQMEHLRDRYTNLNKNLIAKYYQLREDFDRLNLEYEALQKRYEEFDDKCDYNQQVLFENLFYEQDLLQQQFEYQEQFYQEQLYANKRQGPQNSYMNNLQQLASIMKNSTQFGWVPVFRLIKGSGEIPKDVWQSRGSYKKFSRDCDKVYCFSCGNWRSYLIDDWERLGVLKVKIELYTDDERVAYVVFDGRDSNYMNWLQKARLQDSGWDDLSATMETTVIFGIDDGTQGDNFVLNTSFGTCATDGGWLKIITQVQGCPHDLRTTYPSFIYSPRRGSTIYDDEYAEAEIMIISLMFENYAEIVYH